MTDKEAWLSGPRSR